MILSMPQRVRWGIVGVGDVTERKSGPAFQQADRSELVAVMRRDAAKAADFAARHAVPRWYDDADALIADPEVDAVYIATPPDSHRDYVERVAAAGKPVYVEKPMARTATECRAMIDACETAGVPLFVAYYRRAMPRFEIARELISGGRLGEVRSVIIRTQHPGPDLSGGLPWRLDPQVSGGGLFVDLGSHTLDWLDHVFGPVTEAAGRASHPLAGPGSVETVVSASFRFAGGVSAVGLWDFDAAERVDRIEIIGTEGSLALSSFGPEPLMLTSGGVTEEIAAPYPDVVQRPLVQGIVDVLTGRAHTAVSTGESALRTASVVDAVLADYRAEHGISF
ncbi:Oxidoreductase [Micropruina glycogenica]|uniref:Oxidoreductase n=2 Tax=Micropruina glycogenica TaxID=75385 RepID=A0A2N9JFD7_9ACTN|nr:Oxidoreductase [Micropruina glycogenica]